MTSRVGGFSNWQELRDHAIELFGETPHPITEQEIIDAYELHPDHIAKAIESIAATPGIRSGWAVLRKRATTIKTPPSNPTRSSSLNREKQIMRAEQWVRDVGIHVDRPSEILEELFGDSPGHHLLREYAQVDLVRTEAGWSQTEAKGDAALTTRMLDLWAEHRPNGMKIERDATQRSQDWHEQQQLMAASKERVKEILDETQTHLRPPPGDLHEPHLPF